MGRRSPRWAPRPSRHSRAQESKWTEVSGKTGKSVDELKAQYADAAKAISNDTGIALTTILDGFQKAISAGTEGEEAIRLVGEGAKAQAANITSMEEAISAATTAAVAFGEDPVVALNKMIRAAQVGEGDTEDYATAIKGSAPAGRADRGGVR